MRQGFIEITQVDSDTIANAMEMRSQLSGYGVELTVCYAAWYHAVVGGNIGP